MVSRIGKSGRTVTTERAVEQVSAFIVVEDASQHRYRTTFPLCTVVGGCTGITDAYVPLVGIIGDYQAYALCAGCTKQLQFIVIGSEACCSRQTVLTPSILVSQQVIALHFCFCLFLLAYSGFPVTKGFYFAFYTVVKYLDDRGIFAGAV